MHYLTVKDVTASLLRFARVGPEYGQHLVFFQIVGNDQVTRAFQYVLARRQSESFKIAYGYTAYPAYLVRGKWQIKVEPIEAQGVSLRLLTAYIPKGTWEDEEYFFFVTQGPPTSPDHDELFRRWAEQFTPYPIPPSLTVESTMWRSVTFEGQSVVHAEPRPHVLAIKPSAFEEILQEVSHAS